MAGRSAEKVAKTVAENFIRTYGKDKFLRLIDMFKHAEPGPKIAHEFDVSRQRVHQWKVQLGEERILYKLNPAVEDLLLANATGRKMI